MNVNVFDKVECYGLDSVTTQELLEILIGKKQAGLINLQDPQESIGKVAKKKAQALVALTNKIKSKPLLPGDSFRSSKQVYEALRGTVAMKDRECFWLILLNTTNKIIKIIQMFEGGLSTCVVDIKCLLKQAIINNATGIIISHNHPSGSHLPSDQDKALTKKIAQACWCMDIRFLDHVILCEDSFYSFCDNGVL